MDVASRKTYRELNTSASSFALPEAVRSNGHRHVLKLVLRDAIVAVHYVVCKPPASFVSTLYISQLHPCSLDMRSFIHGCVVTSFLNTRFGTNRSKMQSKMRVISAVGSRPTRRGRNNLCEKHSFVYASTLRYNRKQLGVAYRPVARSD